MINNVYLKIHQGTGLLTGESLCKSCSHGHCFIDARGDQTMCKRSSWSVIPVRGKVTQCDGYYNKTLPTLGMMEDIAWTIKTDKAGKAVGFVAPDPKDK